MRSLFRVTTLCSLFAMTLFFTACEKDEDLQPADIQLTARDPETFTYSINPAMVGDSVEIVFDAANGADCGQVHIQYSLDGEDWIEPEDPITPDSGIATLLFVPEEAGAYLVRAKYQRTGSPATCDFENTGWLIAPDTLVVEDDSTGVVDSCETSFTGEAISCDSSREVVFTLVSAEDIEDLKIQGGLGSGVSGDVNVSVDGADLAVTQRTPGHSTNRIIKLTGSVLACDTVTITLTWTSTKPATMITGDWSASGENLDLEVAGLECE